MAERTKEDWKKFILVSVECVSGSCTVPLDHWDRLGLTVAEVIGDYEWQYSRTTLSMVFRKRQNISQIQFGDEMPEKQKKHEAAYVWQSMFSE